MTKEKEKEQIIIENQIAILNLLGYISCKITGRMPTVAVNTESGTLLLQPMLDSIIFSEGVPQNPAELAKGIGKERQPAPVS